MECWSVPPAVDCGRPSAAIIVSGVRLTVQQAPLVGLTVHRLYVQREGGQLQLVKEFNGITQEPQVLTWDANPPLVGVVSVRVETITSPSWVAWKEIEILSGDPGSVCLYSLGSGGQVFSADGGTGTVSVTTGQTCRWSVTGNSPWGDTLVENDPCGVFSRSVRRREFGRCDQRARRLWKSTTNCRDLRREEDEN
jgi:hypothetical protein